MSTEHQSAGVELLDREVEKAIKVGKYVAKSWPVDQSDVVADLYQWLCENERHLIRWRGEGVHGSNKLGVALARRARKFCRHEWERTQHGQGVYREPTYTREEVEAGLEVVLAHPDWGAIAEQGNLDAIACVADVDAAYHGLRFDDKDLLFRRYGLGQKYTEMAIDLELTPDAVRGRVNKVVDRLRERISGEGANWDRTNVATRRPGVQPRDAAVRQALDPDASLALSPRTDRR